MERARLIPVSGISGRAEAEQRATSAFLAVTSIVREFSDQLLGPLGASRASTAFVETFTEVEIKLSDFKVRPDGLVKVSRGKTDWKALIEVKTGDSNLTSDQLNSYLDAAKVIDADLVISISNEIGVAGAHPTEGLNVRSNSRIKVHHYSWNEILSKAVICQVHLGVNDPEQAWILGELIRYLEHPGSGVRDFADMGASWSDVKRGARQGTLNKKSAGVEDVAARWDKLLAHLVVDLMAETGANVTQVLPRSQQNPKDRVQFLTTQLLDGGLLSGEIRVPGSASDITVLADLRAGQVSVEATVVAPQDKLGRGCIGWLTRQLDAAPKDLLIEAYERKARTPLSAALSEVVADPDVVLSEGNPQLSRFRLVLKREAGKSRKSGGRSPGFVETVNDVVNIFYETVLQDITRWASPAPKVKRVEMSDQNSQPPVGSGDVGIDKENMVDVRSDASAVRFREGASQ